MPGSFRYVPRNIRGIHGVCGCFFGQMFTIGGEIEEGGEEERINEGRVKSVPGFLRRITVMYKVFKGVCECLYGQQNV